MNRLTEIIETYKSAFFFAWHGFSIVATVIGAAVVILQIEELTTACLYGKSILGLTFDCTNEVFMNQSYIGIIASQLFTMLMAYSLIQSKRICTRGYLFKNKEIKT